MAKRKRVKVKEPCRTCLGLGSISVGEDSTWKLRPCKKCRGTGGVYTR